MKQGTGHSARGDTKVEPKSNPILPGGINKLGNMHGNHVTDGGDLPFKTLPLTTDGHGLRAPMAGITQHHCGSQGKH